MYFSLCSWQFWLREVKSLGGCYLQMSNIQSTIFGQCYNVLSNNIQDVLSVVHFVTCLLRYKFKQTCRSTKIETVVSDSPTRVTTSSSRVPVVPLAAHYAGKRPFKAFSIIDGWSWYINIGKMGSTVHCPWQVFLKLFEWSFKTYLHAIF